MLQEMLLKCKGRIITSSDDRILKQTAHNMHGPDILQIEVQQSMARIREAASKTQETPAKPRLNNELAKNLPAEFKIKLFPSCYFLDKCLIFSTSFIQILDTFRRIISLDQLSISNKCYIRPVVLFDQMSYSTKCLSTNCRGSHLRTVLGRIAMSRALPKPLKENLDGV